jgi:YD repeat-containing protein
VTQTREYFNLTGANYSTSPNEGPNVYETDYAYVKRGRQARVEDATGTITRTVYDGLDRVVSTWVGLDDVPTSGFWSPSNTAGTDLVMVSQNEYDDGGVGDGNLTSVTMIPGGSEANRTTDFYFEWRNRQVGTKEGVAATERAN